MHEKRMWKYSAFLTLTYEDNKLPRGGTLVLEHLQTFMKRLREKRPPGIRFFACGEYGDTYQRPHYHLLLFNTDFPDMRHYKDNETGDPLYKSKEATELWKRGDVTIANVNFGTCSYVAGYVAKKAGSNHIYGDRLPEFRVMSRNPGLGRTWYNSYHAEAYKSDSVIANGKETGIPRYYDKIRELELYDKFIGPRNDIKLTKTGGQLAIQKTKLLRKQKSRLNPEERTLKRLRARELFAEAKSKHFKRDQ